MKRKMSCIRILAVITSAMIVMGACGTTAEGANDNVSEVTEQEVNNDTDTENVTEDETSVVADTEEELIEEPVEEVINVTADEIIKLVNLEDAGHIQIPTEEILAVAMSFNWDYITDEDKDIIMDTYGVSLEDLDGYFRAYLERDNEMDVKNSLYKIGAIDTLEAKYNYKYWIQYTDYAFNSEDADLASQVGYEFSGFTHTTNSIIDMEKNSFSYTLYYVLYPAEAIEKMENSVFTK